MSVSIIDRLQSGDKNFDVFVPPQKNDKYLIEQVLDTKIKKETITWVCKAKNNNKNYALKICKISSDNKSAIDAIALNHQRMCSSNHSYICWGRESFQIIDDCNSFIEIFLPCELAEKTIYDYINEQQTISEETYIQWINGWIEAFAEIHRKDFVHGDISLKNIFMINSTPKFADFDDYSFGTPYYRHISKIKAEVQYYKNKLEICQFFEEYPIYKRKAMDCYAFGCMLYDLLCHERSNENEIQPVRKGYPYKDHYIYNNERIDINEPIGLNKNDREILKNRLSNIFINNSDYVSKIFFIITKLMVDGGGFSRNTRIILKKNNFWDLDAVQIFNDWKKFTETSKSEINQDELTNNNATDNEKETVELDDESTKDNTVCNDKNNAYQNGEDEYKLKKIISAETYDQPSNLNSKSSHKFYLYLVLFCILFSIFNSTVLLLFIMNIINGVNAYTYPCLIKLSILGKFAISHVIISCCYLLISLLLVAIIIIYKNNSFFNKFVCLFCLLGPIVCLLSSIHTCLLYSQKKHAIIINEIVDNKRNKDLCVGYIEAIPKRFEKNEFLYYAFSPLLKMYAVDNYKKIVDKINLNYLTKGVRIIYKHQNDFDKYFNFLEQKYPQIQINEKIKLCFKYLKPDKENFEQLTFLKAVYIVSKINNIIDNQLEIECQKSCSNIEIEIINKFNMKFKYIKENSFYMGSPNTHTDRDNDEIFYQTELKDFYIQDSEVTQGQWYEIMKTKPWKNQKYILEGDTYPATYISWNDSLAFISKINQLENTNRYRLPAEKEWECACKATSNDRYFWGDKPNCTKANFGFGFITEECIGINPGNMKRIKSYSSNLFNIYDMSGNVWEWCNDVYFDIDKSTSNKRQTRGGSWFSSSSSCRCSNRGFLSPDSQLCDQGFRLVYDINK